VEVITVYLICVLCAFFHACENHDAFHFSFSLSHPSNPPLVPSPTSLFPSALSIWSIFLLFLLPTSILFPSISCHPPLHCCLALSPCSNLLHSMLSSHLYSQSETSKTSLILPRLLLMKPDLHVVILQPMTQISSITKTLMMKVVSFLKTQPEYHHQMINKFDSVATMLLQS
jgi:hypothetical protein